MSRGGFGGVNDFFLRHVRPAVAEIVADRVVEENRFLGDDGHLLAQGPQRDVVDRVAVDAHLAGGDLVETRQEIHEGGFSSATGTDDGHDSSRGNLHIDILQDQSVVIVSESDAIEFNGPGKRRQRLRSGQLHRFTRQIDEGEDLLGDSGGLKEKLVHVAEAFDWLVGLEERVGERYEQTHAHATGLDFAASEKQNERNHDGTEQIHDRRSGGERANPTHVFVQQLARGLTEFADFEAFHAEGLHDAIAGDRFLENLAQVREPRAAFFRRTADLATEFADRPHHQWNQDRGAQRHAPVDDQQNGDKRDQREALAEPFRKPIGKRVANLLDIGDHRGHHAPDRIVLEESDGLLDDLFVNLIANVGDDGKPHVLDQNAADIFANSFHERHQQERDCEYGPHVMKMARCKGVQIHHVAGEGNLEERQRLGSRMRIQNHVEGRTQRKSYQEFDHAHHRDQHNSRRETWNVGPQVAEETADFVVLGYTRYAVDGFKRQVK